MVKNKKFGFRAPIGYISDFRALEILFRSKRHPTRIPLVDGPGNRILHVGNQAQRWYFHKWIHAGGIRVGHNQHVAILDHAPAPNRRSIKSRAFLKKIQRQL